ncbi:PAQR family membrane homeostasis protein TrhA [Ulvibacter litoralis]|uniref:Hemolysin III n=1 Tax=Ulvibacter litoralis TaxID=227084 RepID=A0A1G7FWI4_9FLAO|nr:hemolysin III family protein [Ulvibacter litoralis]GHC64103.1 hemolysin D [Ulvibacter litoralis]SDE80105.1 hemolysin III [Ulvibacter litoralis]
MRIQSPIEERYNVLTHSIGFVFSLVGFVLMLCFNQINTFWGMFSIVLYGCSLSLLYLVSSLYHHETDVTRKHFFRKLDHISIYFLIAGTYSPVVLITLEDSHGWILFCTVWGIALFGTFMKIFFTGRFEFLSVLLYLIMGWLIVFDFSALQARTDAVGINLLMGGGIAYTVGIVFYALDRFKYTHVIWHLFVLCGSILHFLFVFLKVI